MSSTFFGLTIGYSGLTAYQAALNTTGNNISNAETEGYSRQTVTQQASRALRTYTSYGMAGSGTTVTSIDQVRNAYYDIKYWNASSQLGEYTVKADYMKQIENYFNDDGESILGFNTIYTNQFYDALEDLQNNPGDASVRTTFIGAAQSVTEYFNSLAENLTKLQQDANNEIKNKVDQINSIASQIATLNKQINIIEIKGYTANELRDQRNLLVDQLSSITDVEVTESPIYNNDDPDCPIGTNRYIVTIAGSSTLVDGYDYNELECISRDAGDKVNQSDADGLYDIQWKSTGMPFNPNTKNISGELKSLFQIRDGNNSEYFNGTIKDYTATNTTTGAAATVTIDANAAGITDITKLTLNETGTITLKNAEYKFTGWTYNDDGTYTFTLADQDSQTNKLEAIDGYTGSTATVGQAVDYQGIPYYMEQMNEWIRNFARTFNDIEISGTDAYGNSLAGDPANGIDPTSFFVASDITDSNNQYNFSDKDSVSSTSDSYYLLTAANFTVSKTMLDDANRMSTTAGDGSIDKDASDIVDQLEKIKDDKSLMSFRGCSSSEFLQCVLSDVALSAGNANSFETNYTNIQNAVKMQRLTVSGVDDDEEAINLVKYQNAYNLSSKMIQVMTEIYDRLILQTGV